jgi:peptidoglycan L-alanyl-D-glutamate endopeptidase CwlK
VTDSRSLADLHPTVRDMATRLLADAEHAGIPCVVTFTYRSLETQKMLYSLGRTLFRDPRDGKKFKPGQHVTNAPAGSSFHNYRLALDVLPKELAALPNWGDTPAHQARTNELWAKLGAIGKAIGFRWGGDFHSIKDRPHFEWSGALSLADLRAGKRP